MSSAASPTRAQIRAFLRPRPTDSPSGAIEECDDGKTLRIRRGHSTEQRFAFERILSGTTQEEVYEAVGRPAVENAVDGFNACVLAYGQTGAGKTHTMSGGKRSFNQRGIIPRAISHVFRELARRHDLQGQVYVSYCEIYNEGFIDLLNPDMEPGEVSIHEDTRGAVRLKGLSSPAAPSEEDALAFLFEGDANRAIAENQLNKRSSRSHTVFTLHLRLHGLAGPSSEECLAPKLQMVDLAGSERLEKTGSEGTSVRQAQYINRSLSFLEQVIVALGTRNREHVPYRSSKLTHLLKDSLGGSSMTYMVATVWPKQEHLEDTVTTCKLAQRMQRVHNEVSRSVKEDPEATIRRLERQVNELKHELALRDGSADSIYDPYTDEMRRELREKVHAFLESPQGPEISGGDGSTEPLQITSIRSAKEALLQCRHLYQQARQQQQQQQPPAQRPPSAAKETARKEAQRESTAYENQAENGVGELEEDGQGPHGVGVAPAEARPELEIGERPQASESKSCEDMESATSKQASKTKSEAFEEYKAGEGKELFSTLQENKHHLREKRARAKELGQEINSHKRELDEIRPYAREGDEWAAQRARELKRLYREAYDEYKAVRSEASYLSHLVEQCTSQLVREFEEWHKRHFGESLDFPQSRTESQASALHQNGSQWHPSPSPSPSSIAPSPNRSTTSPNSQSEEAFFCAQQNAKSLSHKGIPKARSTSRAAFGRSDER